MVKIASYVQASYGSNASNNEISTLSFNEKNQKRKGARKKMMHTELTIPARCTQK